MASRYRMPRPKAPKRRVPSGQRTDSASKEIRGNMRRLAREVQDATDEKYDGWHNAITRLGERLHDKRLYGRHNADRIIDLEAEDIWRGDALAARAVEEVPNQILRAGVEVQIQQDPGESEKADGRRRRVDRLRWMRSDEGRRWWGKRIDALQASLPVKEQLRAKIRKDLASEVFPDESGTAATQQSKEMQEAIGEQMDELEVLETFTDAMKAESGYGGAAVFPIIRDGETDLSKPLDHDRIQSVDGLDWLTPLELIPFQWYAEPTDLYFGRPQLYWMQRISIGNIGASVRIPIHESRLITFPGVVVSRRQLREHWGWGDSLLVRMKEVLRDFGSSHQGAAILMTEFAQAYMKIKGLNASFASSESTLLAQRATAFQEGISIARVGIIDAEEEYGRVTTPVSGLPELLDRMANLLAATAEMPVTILMGQAPAGLNATGASDIRAWYDKIDRLRREKLARRLRKFMMMLFAAEDGPTGGSVPDKWSFKWGHLWQPTEQEQAQARYLVAQADQIYIAAGVLIAEEVARSRFGGDEYSAETQLDADIRDSHDDQVEMEAEQEAEMHQAKVKQLTTPKPAPVIAGAPGAAPVAAPKAATDADDVPTANLGEDLSARPPPKIEPDEPMTTAKRKRKRRKGTTTENGIVTAGAESAGGAGGTKAPKQPPTEARYKMPKPPTFRATGPEVPVGKFAGPQSV
jgi:uncharacterized protein